MSKRWVTLTICLVAAFLTTGCMSSSGGIAGSTKPLNPGQYTVIGEASGSSWGIAPLGIPFSEAGPETALRRALESSGGDALIEVTVANRMYYLFFLNVFQTQVTGTAVQTYD